MASAVYYTYSASQIGTGDGSSWANACNTLAGAFTAVLALAGGAPFTVYADSTSIESYSPATTLTAGADAAHRIAIISVNKTGSVPPAPADFVAGAKIATAVNIGLTLAGFAYAEGLIVSTGGSASGTAVLTVGNSANTDWIFGPGCQNIQASAQPSAYINIGTSATYNQKVMLRGGAANREPKVKFGHINQTFYMVGGALVLRDLVLLDSAGSTPTNLFTWNSAKASSLDAEGVDFTGMGTTLLNVGTPAGIPAVTASFRDCLIPSGVTTLVGGTAIPPGSRVSFARCSTGAGAFSDRLITYEGWQVEDASITLQGGATDNTTLRSWHLSTNAANTSGTMCGTSSFGATWAAPFEGQPIFVWNDTVGSPLTFTLQGLWTGTAVPNNDDVWIDLEAETAPGTSLGIGTSGTKAGFNAASAANPAGSGTWNNAGNVGANPKQFAVQATITPQQKGWIKITPKLAKASTDVWIDPKPAITGYPNGGTQPAISRSYVTPSGAMVHEAAATVTNTVTQVVPMVRRVRR